MSSKISNKYTPQKFEAKWVKKWEKEKLFQDTYKQKGVTPKNKKYLLFAFAYPSGSGLHVGHFLPYTALDVLARYCRMNGEKVFFPVGWDAFGLPAENYAIKTGVHPSVTTKKAIEGFKSELKRAGISKDWGSEIATCDPEYYKWTQWIFLQMYKNDLAYKKEAAVNWCPSCQTVLANEQVVTQIAADEKADERKINVCERCDTEVIQKELEQWFFKITDYKDELIEDLEKVDWPKSTKQQQKNWIGKSTGAKLQFKIQNSKLKIDELDVFTTRPDTIFGATFMVVAPEHPLIAELLKSKFKSRKSKVEEYVEKAKKKTEEERLINKQKTGVFTGLYAVNPASNKEIPIYVSDYVLMGYGTGAIMAVPAHDDRDYDFAVEHDLDINPVVAPDRDFKSQNSKPQSQTNSKQFNNLTIEQFENIYSMNLPYMGSGILINSEELDNIKVPQEMSKVIKWVEKKGIGKRETTYKLRDWLISRQRYWGAPIPIVYDPKGEPHAVKEEHLPWMLPTDVDFNPTGESPLKSSKEFKERVEKLYGKDWVPEYDTMDTFVDSSWYFMRYIDPNNDKEFASSDQLEKWLPVDFYLIGAEHTVLHLLYSRFFTKFLRDAGYLNFDEPFVKMRHQGMILGPDNKKMSKSKGNTITPEEMYQDYGADTMRVYEMFMGPLYDDKPWDESSVLGIYRFLGRVWSLYDSKISEETPPNLKSNLHQTINKVRTDIEDLKFNTAIAQMMSFSNDWGSSKTGLSKDDALIYLKLLAPFAPFITEEIYNDKFKDVAQSNENEFNKLSSIHTTTWPKYDKELAKEQSIVIPVQVNGKRRNEIEVSREIVEDNKEVIKKARESVSKYTKDTKIKKEIYVPGKIVNFVV